MKFFAEIVDKYGIALSSCLYPSQIETLHNALEYWRVNEELPYIDDSFTRLAFLMVVSDLLYHERKEQRHRERSGEKV